MKVPPFQVYNKLCERFEGREISLRKQMCMAYLKWKYYRTQDLKVAMCELAKEFRKGRQGGKRTIIERRIRRHFKGARVHQNTESRRDAARAFNEKLREEKRGVFSEESLSKRSQVWKDIHKRFKAENDSPRMKTYVVTKPDGTKVAVHGLLRFTEEHGLSRGRLHVSARSPWKRKGDKGYSARYWDPETDQDIPWHPGCELPERRRRKLEEND